MHAGHEPGPGSGQFTGLEESGGDGEGFVPAARKLNVAAQDLIRATVVSLPAPETGHAEKRVGPLEQTADRARIVSPGRLVPARAVVRDHREKIEQGAELEMLTFVHQGLRES